MENEKGHQGAEGVLEKSNTTPVKVKWWAVPIVSEYKATPINPVIF
jgi:hypothetical protein